ncbi:MAG: glucose-6-phosphate isomerase [Verrucomicrobiaceae bacterium]|nr:glucose-6-phosphate isomerase [Verrucomicrobiaceae bacterium]
MSKDPTWQEFSRNLLRYSDPDLWLDFSRMVIPADYFEEHAGTIERASNEMQRIEAGELVNTDEGRMVGHYWLRTPSLAPEALEAVIMRNIAEVKAFASGVHQGEILTPAEKTFQHLLVIGIGGSALGPQLAIDALTGTDIPMSIHFFDNTDPDGIDRILATLGEKLDRTLTLVISKSGGTKETRNGMLEAKTAYEDAGLDFGSHAVAITAPKSKLDQVAGENNWMGRFAMDDWVGGRTSITSVVGLVPMALAGIDIDEFIAGAAATDAKTRGSDIQDNAAMLMAIAWHHAGKGKGNKAMVILPYKDRLRLLSSYLQQLVMESIGKELDRNSQRVHQGITVFGNKGSTDQHAYVQQLRDGPDNFFATFIEIRKTRSTAGIEVEPGITTGDYLEGFLRGTRQALFESGRKSITISIPCLNAYYLGCLVALYERAVSFYAGLININAYHQPGVEAGKAAAGEFLGILSQVEAQLQESSQQPVSAEEIASAISADPEDAFHALWHLAANRTAVTVKPGANPTEDRFTLVTE